jgi:SAM-dependent methyltransferase
MGIKAGISKLLNSPAMLNRIQWVVSLGKQCNKEWLREAMKPNIQDSVLDVGCGTGRYADLFNCNYTGIDSNPEYIAYAQKAHKGKFLSMEANQLEFPDSTFHYVFCVGLLHHMNDNMAAVTFKEMKRVCRAGGRIVILEPIYPTNKLNIFGYIICRCDRGKFIRYVNDLAHILSNTNCSGLNQVVKKSFPFEDAVFTCDKID